MDEQWRQYYDLINSQQQQNNAWSASQAQKAMDYQTQMSNTAHQREVADLKAAGLNPVLSAGGSGATTGSGVAASAGNENVTALYGLAKQAIDANMKQADAMANAAKYISSALTSHPFSISPNTNSIVDDNIISPNPYDISEDNPIHNSGLGDIIKNVLAAFMGKQKAEGVYNALTGISRWTAVHSGGDYNNDGQITESELKNWKGIMSFILGQDPFQNPHNMNIPLNVLHPENTKHGYEGGYNPYKLVELGILSPEDVYSNYKKKKGSGKFRPSYSKN